MYTLSRIKVCKTCYAFEPTTRECRRRSPSLSMDGPWPRVQEDWWCCRGRWSEILERDFEAFYNTQKTNEEGQ
jgi:hypothetical protein